MTVESNFMAITVLYLAIVLNYDLYGFTTWFTGNKDVLRLKVGSV